MEESIDVIVRETKQINESAYELGFVPKKVRDFYNHKLDEYKKNNYFQGVFDINEVYKRCDFVKGFEKLSLRVKNLNDVNYRAGVYNRQMYNVYSELIEFHHRNSNYSDLNGLVGELKNWED